VCGCWRARTRRRSNPFCARYRTARLRLLIDRVAIQWTRQNPAERRLVLRLPAQVEHTQAHQCGRPGGDRSAHAAIMRQAFPPPSPPAGDRRRERMDQPDFRIRAWIINSHRAGFRCGGRAGRPRPGVDRCHTAAALNWAESISDDAGPPRHRLHPCRWAERDPRGPPIHEDTPR